MLCRQVVALMALMGHWSQSACLAAPVVVAEIMVGLTDGLVAVLLAMLVRLGARLPQVCRAVVVVRLRFLVLGEQAVTQTPIPAMTLLLLRMGRGAGAPVGGQSIPLMMGVMVLMDTCL